MNRNTLVIALAAAAVVLLSIGLIAAPKLTDPNPESTRVDAPFTSVETGEDKTRVRAPFVDVEVPNDKKESTN